ncbi:tyrosine-type recombinase/integrase [Mangrovimonas sp. YM274]|uniref:tyrosine-type recombinase/integrase n=1 Tax=Mangrovimonas sp. YM274 TaxID=3070660 RepID=UPI0027DE1742|nr:tyrosine-type recombinase/integrase [Mangrovimonas sp. YM274]WMI68805.1 tyrosine-type recombinase/integrase [Mangrovimonas sp. YM274]
MGYSTVKLYKENKNKEKFVVIYYKHDGSAIRHRTGITISEKDFDKKAEKIKPSHPSNEDYNKIIGKIQRSIENIIIDYINEHGIKPNSDYVKTQIASGLKERKDSLEADIIDCYEDFLSEKKIMFSSPERSTTSLKDYISTKNALQDYSKVIGHIRPSDINNTIWLTKFNKFLAETRPNITGYKFVTSAQNDKTRAKRFGVLKNFGDWLLKEKYLKDIDALKNFKVKVDKKTYYTLSLEELSLIQNHHFKSLSHQKAIDMFIVACHTGLRFSDVIRISKTKITKKNDAKILSIINQKTKIKVEVPLTDKVLSILKKYDYHLNLLSSQKTNEYIHEGLKNIKEFHELQENSYDGDELHIYDLITFHTGRRTFITNLVNNNVSLNAIMKMTGHRKISTLQQYINPDYNLIMDNVRIFNSL